MRIIFIIIGLSFSALIVGQITALPTEIDTSYISGTKNGQKVFYKASQLLTPNISTTNDSTYINGVGFPNYQINGTVNYLAEFGPTGNKLTDSPASDDNTTLKVAARKMSLTYPSALQNLIIGDGGNGSMTGQSNFILGNNSPGLNITSGNTNLFIGNSAGQSITSGFNNILFGNESGRYTSTGIYNGIGIGAQSLLYSSSNNNIGIGISAGSYIYGPENITIGTTAGFGQSGGVSTGSYNIFQGYRTGYFFTTGSQNVAIGREGMYNVQGGQYNTSIGGYRTLFSNVSGVGNVAIGRQAGYSALGNYNVFIGYDAGYSETGSNTLYIENTNSATPLIGGNFSSNRVGINKSIGGLSGTLHVGGNLFVDTRTATASTIGAWSSTGEATQLTIGTGVGVSGGALVNTAPDQTVTILGLGIANVTGTYPNFSITATETDGDINNERGTLSRSNDSLFYKQCPTCPTTFVTKIDTANVSGSGITSLNGLSTASQIFSTGTSGSDFNISSSTSTHTFNVPTASGSARGALSSSDWTTFNSKVGGSGTTNYMPRWTATGTQGNSGMYNPSGGGTFGIGTTVPSNYLVSDNGIAVNGTTPAYSLNNSSGYWANYLNGAEYRIFNSVMGEVFSIKSGGVTSTNKLSFKYNSLQNAAGLVGYGVNGSDWEMRQISVTSGLNLSTSGVLTNTAPDQTVTLTQGGTTTITGTYPNFTISSADQYVGTVTSVGLSLPATIFSVSGSPVTSAGTLTASLASQTTNKVFASPNGSTGTPTFRSLVVADLPSLSTANLTDFPTQTGNSGKYLTTNGTSLSWATVPGSTNIYNSDGTIPATTFREVTIGAGADLYFTDPSGSLNLQLNENQLAAQINDGSGNYSTLVMTTTYNRLGFDTDNYINFNETGGTISLNGSTGTSGYVLKSGGAGTMTWGAESDASDSNELITSFTTSSNTVTIIEAGVSRGITAPNLYTINGSLAGVTRTVGIGSSGVLSFVGTGSTNIGDAGFWSSISGNGIGVLATDASIYNTTSNTELSINSTGGKFEINGSYGTSGYVLKSGGSGSSMYWDVLSGSISGLTTGYIPYANSSSTIANGPLYRLSSNSVSLGTTTNTNLLGRSGINVMDTDPALVIGKSTSHYWYHYLNGNDYEIYNPNYGEVMKMHTTGRVKIRTLQGTGNRYVYADASGNLYSSTYDAVGGSGTGGYVSRWFSSGVQDNSGLYNTTAGGGVFGIGTTTPASYLVSDNGLAVRGTTPAFSLSNTSGYYAFYLNSGDLRIFNSVNGEVLTVDGGNVGINQVNPSAKLEVNGTFKTSSTNTLTNLAGSGDRLVQASSTGVLSATSVLPYDQINTYTSSSTWTKPSGCASVTVKVIGGGGGGGSGGYSNGSATSGGGGGGAGGYSEAAFPCSGITSTVTVTIGAGGDPGGGINGFGSMSSGNAGVSGGTSSFGSYIKAAGGGGGAGGSVSGASGGTGGAGTGRDAGAGGTSSASLTSGGTAPQPPFSSSGGNGGAGTNGTSTGSNNSSSVTPLLSTSGSVTGFGTGGTGGGSTTASGGNGNSYGGGGGGGAAKVSTTSGDGGFGADGIIIVITHF